MKLTVCKILVVIASSCFSRAALSRQLHSEVSLSINPAQASQLISSLKLRLSSRFDHYLDYYHHGKFQLLAGQSNHKIRLMVDESKAIKLQKSDFKSAQQYDCSGASILLVTRSSEEIKANQDELIQMVSAQRRIIDALVNTQRDQLLKSEKLLLNMYEKISRDVSDFPDKMEKYPGVMTASYSSSKKKYKRELTMDNGHKLEMSITYARNFLNSEIFKDEISLEFEKIGDYGNDDFSEHVCNISENLYIPIEIGHSSSPSIWQKAEYLNRLIRE